MAYEYLEHTADVKFLAQGKTLEKAFSECAKATIDVMVDHRKIERSVSKEVRLKASKVESLLYDFLEEILFYLDSEELLLPYAEDVRITEVKDGLELTCTLAGDLAANHETVGDVKAATYSEMKIEKTEQGYALTVVLDI